MEFKICDKQMLASVILNDTETKVIIPENITSIRGLAFFEKNFIEEVIFPSTLKIINGRAFESCENLKKITIPDSVSYIGPKAFCKCKNLKSVTLPKNLLLINDGVFLNCLLLDEINIPCNLVIIEKNAFQYTALKELILPDSITDIGESAFSNMYNLKKVKLPKNLEVIKDETFKACKSLQVIKFPNNLKKIGNRAFKECYSLEKFNLPDSITNIDENAFSNMCNLKKVKLPCNLEELKGETFKECTSLISVQLPSNLKKIGSAAFSNCCSLEKINFPNTLTEIMNGAFSNCKALKEINLPNNLKEIKAYSFENTNLKQIIIPNSVEIINNMAFGLAPGEEIYLGDNCTRISQDAFKGCKTKKIRIGNFTQLSQPGLIGVLDLLNYFYINKETHEILGFDKPQNNLVNYEKINYDDWYKNLEEIQGKKGKSIILSLIADENKNYVANDDLNNLFLNILKIVNRENYDEIKKSLDNSKTFFDMLKKTYYYKEMKAIISYNSEIYANLFTLAYTLGAFNDNQIERQKACEFLHNVLDKKELELEDIYEIFNPLEFNGYNKEWAEFFMNKNNFKELLKLEENQEGYIARVYNNFEQIREFGRSNRGSQNYRKVTLDMCNNYLLESVFTGVDESTKSIAHTISAYTRSQMSFNWAVSIKQEYDKLKSEGKVNNHLLEEKIIDSKKEILKDINDTLSQLSELANNKFTYEFLSKEDPANFVLGKYCSCCSHLEGAGYGVMRASIIHPDCQNIVIRNEKGKIIAKSTLYVNKSYGYGVLNNFEVNNNFKDEEILKMIYLKFKQAINEFAIRYNKIYKDNPLTQINVGMGINDLKEVILENDRRSREILQGIHFYDYGTVLAEYDGDWQDNQHIFWSCAKDENKR